MAISEKKAYELGLIGKPVSKYNVSKNKEIRTCGQGHVHASQKECLHCDTLRLMKRSGEIAGYDTEVNFEIQPEFMAGDEKVRAIRYRADFVVHHHDGTTEVIDVKGFQTAVFKLKWKMLKYSLSKSRKEYILTII